MGQDMNYPDRLISDRVQAINDEMAKQRQHLPVFKNQYQNVAASQHSQRTEDARQQLNNNPQGRSSMIEAISQDPYENTTNFNNALVDQGYAVVARHYAQSAINPPNFRDNIQQLHEQQRLQM